MSPETFTTNSDDFESTGIWSPCDKRSLKTVKLGHLMARLVSILCHLVTRVTPGTVDVKISAASKALVKACKYKIDIKRDNRL